MEKTGDTTSSHIPTAHGFVWTGSGWVSIVSVRNLFYNSGSPFVRRIPATSRRDHRVVLDSAMLVHTVPCERKTPSPSTQLLRVSRIMPEPALCTSPDGNEFRATESGAEVYSLQNNPFLSSRSVPLSSVLYLTLSSSSPSHVLLLSRAQTQHWRRGGGRLGTARSLRRRPVYQRARRPGERPRPQPTPSGDHREI